MNIVIIGGGPAGILAAISASRPENNVTILEKMDSIGRKLLITGKGRCNITSSLDMSEFIKNIPGNAKFLYSAFKNFTNKDIIELLENEGVKLKVERGNRVFPVSDKSLEVLNAFKRILKRLNVNIILNSRVEEILIKGKNVCGVVYNKNHIINADKVILATGGKSYPLTGSTGDGYVLAKKLGHSIIDLKPSLVPLEVRSIEFCKQLQGLNLKNVKIKINDIKNNKIIYQDFGEMIFTHFGVSGPTILGGSAHLIRYKDIDQLLISNKIELLIDLKPALTNETLNIRLVKDFEQFKNKQFKNSLYNLLPNRLIENIIKLSDINPNKKVNEITKDERQTLVYLLKNLKITIKGFRSIEEAIITSGGVNVKEIDPKTMESKIIKNLYFAGEIIDVDAYTGGFNLQIAYSTGYTAGINLD